MILMIAIISQQAEGISYIYEFCLTFDSVMKFTEMALYDQGGKSQVTPTWQVLDNGGDHCTTTATVIDPTSVNIQF
jgi:hypothetical protein